MTTQWLVPVDPATVDQELRQAAREAEAFAAADLWLRRPPELVWCEPSDHRPEYGEAAWLASIGDDGDKLGVTRRGEGFVWIVASRVGDADEARRVVWHEAAHHKQEETGRCDPLDELGTRYQDRPSEIEAREYERVAARAFKRSPTPSTMTVREWSPTRAIRDATLDRITQRLEQFTNLVGAATRTPLERRSGPDATGRRVGSGRQQTGRTK